MTLQNIDEHLTTHKVGQNYNFEAVFGDIEAIVQAVAKDDTTLLIDNTDWKKTWMSGHAVCVTSGGCC